jgi:YegS/Rv2252/BmrU family lipid kinase
MSADGHDGSRVSIRAVRSVFVVNPVSGRPASRARRRERIAAFIAQHGLDSRLLESRGAGHATELSRAAVADGVDLVVSVGGDGTMNEVGTPLIGQPTMFALVPCGSGNGLARDLGVPQKIDRALALLLDAQVRVIDTGLVNEWPFFNVAGLGFDAELSRRFNRCKERGLISYFRLGFGALVTERTERLVIEPEGAPAEELTAFMTAIANSTQYGNNAHIAPHARLDDGRLDVVVVKSGNPVLAFWLGLRAFAGTIDRASCVRSMQARSFTIRRAKAGPIHTDGEVRECPATLAVRAVPSSLRVLVPPDLRGEFSNPDSR